MEAIAIRLEAIAIRLEAIAIRLEAIAIRLEAIATRWRPLLFGAKRKRCASVLRVICYLGSIPV